MTRAALFDDGDLSREGEEIPWTAEEMDHLYHLYYGEGHSYNQLAAKFQRTRKSISNLIDKVERNWKGRAERYRPFRRESRFQQRFTPNELKCIKSHREIGLPVEVTCRLLARKPEELKGKPEHEPQAAQRNSELRQMQTAFADISVDVILAIRYALESYHMPVTPLVVYEHLKAEAIEFGGAGPELEKYQDLASTPHRCKTLALYLVEREEDKKGGPLVRYAIGEKTEDGGVGMYFGPCASIAEVKGQIGRSARSRIYQLNPDKTTRAIARWDEESKMWVWRR